MNYRVIQGTLVARTAVHIGTGEGGDITDGPYRRNAQGDYLIPGTALAGALRTLATRQAPRLFQNEKPCKALQEHDDQEPCGCRVCQLFGEIHPSEDEKAGGNASRLFFAHALAVLPAGITASIRDNVGIERTSRTSARAASAKFDLEVLPRGTKFHLRIELNPAVDSQGELLLAAALAEWQAERLWLGGRVARGLGAFVLKDVSLVKRELSVPDDLLAYLQDDTPWQNRTGDTDWIGHRLQEARAGVHSNYDKTYQGVLTSSFATLECTLKTDGSFLVNDPLASAMSGFDHAPLLNVVSRKGKPILPGASLRGVLRSQAERIARTLVTLDTDDPLSFGKRCPACDPLQRSVQADKNKKAIPLASCDMLLQDLLTPEQEAKDEHLCLACRLFGSSLRGTRLFVEDAEAAEAIADNDDKNDKNAVKKHNKINDFLGIDRFTGGGRAGVKFDAFATRHLTFKVRLHLENPAAWELGWLALALRDLHDGLVAVGFGGAKGFGKVALQALTLRHGFLDDEDCISGADFADASPGQGLYRELIWDTRDAEQGQRLLDIARTTWVKSFNKECHNFERKPDLALTADTYFDATMPMYYDKEAYEWLLKP